MSMGKRILVVMGTFSLVLLGVLHKTSAHTTYNLQSTPSVGQILADSIKSTIVAQEDKKESTLILPEDSSSLGAIVEDSIRHQSFKDSVLSKSITDSIAHQTKSISTIGTYRSDTLQETKAVNNLLERNSVDSIIGIANPDSVERLMLDSVGTMVPDLEKGDKLNMDSLRAAQEARELAQIDSLRHYRMLLDSLHQVRLLKIKEEAIKQREAYLANTPSDLYKTYFADTYEADSIAPTAIYVSPDSMSQDSYRLFLPLMYYNDVPTDEELISQDSISQYSWNKVVLRNIYREHPELIKYSKKYIEDLPEYRDYIAVENKKKTEARIANLFKPELAPNDVVDKDVDIHKPNFWTYLGEGSLQFTQNYISENWYKGGENSNRLLGSLKLQANYNDKQKIEWENMFEANLGFATVPSDTVHQYNVSTNLIRLTSKFGVQASKHWYYTANSEFSTQLVRNYQKNTDQLLSAFMSPADFYISLGMDYKLEKKKYNLSVAILPASWNYRWVSTDDIDETKYGLSQGENSLSTIGSTLKSTLTWEILPYIKLDSRFNYFTNYQKVEVSWENTFNLILNKHLSTKLFVHGRFDDGVTKVDNTYFQLNELLSFGINYQW